jgi:hypothetical protein
MATATLEWWLSRQSWSEGQRRMHRRWRELARVVSCCAKGLSSLLARMGAECDQYQGCDSQAIQPRVEGLAEVPIQRFQEDCESRTAAIQEYIICRVTAGRGISTQEPKWGGGGADEEDR